MKWIWIMLTVLAVGCISHGPMPFHYLKAAPDNATVLKTIPIWVDDSFGEADRISLEDALHQWNYALNGYVELKVVSWHFNMEPEVLETVMHGGGWVILKIDHNSTFIHDAPNHFTLAFADSVGGNRVYFIRDRIQNSWMTGLALHEIGHLLGAKHDDHDLMQPYFNWEEMRCIDQPTILQVAEFEHLPASRLNYCVYGYDESMGVIGK